MARILLSKPMKSSMWMCMLAILFLLCACAPPCHAVKYLEAVITGSTNADIPLIQAGWKAAAKKLGVESAMSSFTMGATLGQSIAAAVTSSQALAVFGLYDDEATSLVMQSTEFTNAKLVLFGPYTESMGIRVWSDNVYFMSADPMTELISLLNWALSKPVSLGNVGWMFLTGNLFDDSLEGKLTDQLLFLGLGAPVVYNELAANGYNAAKFSALMAQTPTCMFVFGARGTHTTTFFQNLIMNAYVKNAANKFYVMLPFSLMHTTSEAFQKLYIVDATKVMPMANIRYSSPLPSPSSTAFSAGATFTAAMTAFNSGYTSATLTTTSGFLAFYGWLFMQQINYIGNTYNLGGGLNYADLKTNTFTQNRYIFGDLVLGNYGGKCPNEATATLLGAACSCNQGGHIVTIVKMTNIVTQNLPINSGVTLDSDGFYIYPNTPCRGSNLNVSGRIGNLVGGVVTVASSATSTMSAQVLAALTASSDTSLFGLKSPLTFTASSIDTTAANMVATLKTKFTVNMLRVLLGPMAAPFQPETMSDFLIVDPITIPPPLERAYAPNVMYLSSSLRQEFYTAASYLGSSAMLALKPDVHIRVRCENDEFVVNAISGSLGYFNVPLTSAIGVGWTVSFVNEIPTSGYTFVVGLTASDISPLKAFLIANKNANVIMWFDEFTALYDTIASVFTLTESPFMSQLLFSTNIPSWTQSGSATNAQKFVSKLSNANKSPVAMRAFLGAMVVDQLTLGSSNISAAALRQQMGDRALFAVDDVPLGPYFDGSSADAQTFGSANTKCPILPKLAVDECSSYTGARDVSLWSYKRVATPATALLHNPGYQPMFYASVQYATKAPPTVSTTTATPATTITTTVTTTTVMPTRLPPCGITTTTRDPFPIISTTTEAPSTTTEPKSGGSDAGLYAAISILSLLFIAACLVAVQLSFMVLPCCAASTFVTAPCDADAATTIVFTEVERWKDVQRAAPEAASECIAEYRSLVRRLVVKYQCYETGSLSDAFMLVARDPSRALKFAASLQKELDGMHGPAVDAVDAAYAGLGLPSSVSVRGLRVRVGVHTDVVDIAYDVDTDHYEYRGSGCVAALRTERLAHGGQVLVTGATCEALTEKQLGEVHAVSLGSQSFPEYEESVSLFELVVLPHREMGGLCRGGTVENNDPVLSLCSDAFDGGSVDATSFALSREVLMLALSPLTPKERLIVLLGKCEERGLRVPRRGKGVTEERYADSLLNMLAQCMAAPACLCRSGAGDSAGGDSSWLTDDMNDKSAAPYVAEEPSVDLSAVDMDSEKSM